MHNNRSRRTRRGQYSSTRSPKPNYRPNRNNRPRAKRTSRHGKYIDPSRFVKVATLKQHQPYIPENSFDQFQIDNLLKQNLRTNNFTKPSQIQDKAIPLALKGHDIIGIANTGTGKTAAFLIPLINKLITDNTKKALIICPTRELAVQTQQESRWLAKGSRLYDALLIGGTAIGRQFRELRNNPEIICGTPGRIKDHLERGSLKLDDISTIVLDEVDRMLDMGFIHDIRSILSHLPRDKQSMFFSATIDDNINHLIKSFTNDATTVMARTAETSDNVNQSVLNFRDDTDKISKLHDLLIIDDVEKTLIFCETKRSTEKLSKELVSRGFTSDAIHGNKSQGQRQRALRKFRDNQVDILVATDVAARGIDVDGITHVVNYDIPHTYDDYTHRIGRTGRANNTGQAITFVMV